MKTLVHTEQDLMEEVIRQCQICYVGIADTDGTPYVIPMNFGYKEGIVYLHSGPEGRSLSILERNPRVCITFYHTEGLVNQHPEVACSYSMKGRSVIGWGTVEFEEDMEKKREILDIFMKQYISASFKYSDPAVRNVKIWKIALESMSCKEFGVRPQIRYT
ncbi:MAG: pyridoxamine 5'-phosphate oxidase family protein [Tannerellaceae bacterium]|nr:pyridoxamine 5'-phosphate oxidase family protein [Tannerellaceae bacterium]